MASILLEIVTSDCMAILIQIGMEVLQTEKNFRMLLQFGVSHDFMEKQEEFSISLSMKEVSTLQHVPPVVKPYGFRSC
jgi:hypothetical protein